LQVSTKTNRAGLQRKLVYVIASPVANFAWSN